ncbi:MAG: hypothetical protein IJJ25_03060 [Lachnospiraceae bacterium]|nr:hypothetical protein [Lachnospiraceae bacterium]
MDKEKITNLTNEQLDGVTGGEGTKTKKDPGYEMVKCPYCGTENKSPLLVRPGYTITCSGCRTVFEP